MKQISSLFLALSILIQASTPALWVLDYQLRRTVYLKHCENKDKPMMHCNGQCHLKKQIAASTGNDPKAPRLPDNFFNIRDLNLYCEAPPSIVYLAPASRSRQTFPPYQRFCPDTPPGALFKPPASA